MDTSEPAQPDAVTPAEADGVIIDRREIRFSARALKRVIDWSLDSKSAHGLPPIIPERVELLPQDHRVDLIYDLEPPAWSFPLRMEALGKLLIAYCLQARIPVPRVARKEIRIGQRYAALVFVVDYSQAPPPQAAEPSEVGQGPMRKR